MTSLAAREPTVRTFTATVESIEDTSVVLDESHFYPEGGGQPADRGTIAGVDVVDVQSGADGVVHELATAPPMNPGDAVEAVVDDPFRTYCMRAHTASHLLYGAGRRLLADLGYGGFDIAASSSDGEDGSITGKIRVDFATTTDVDDDALVELERLTNRAVWDAREVTWAELPKAEALDREDIAFNTKTEEGLGTDTVRVVTVDGWDVAACGGTHVHNTIAVGPVTVLDRSNPGEGLTRVEFSVGPSAIERRARDHARARTAARALDTQIDELPEAVGRLQDTLESVRGDRDRLRESVVEERLASLREDIVEIEGTSWLVGILPGLDANELADRAQSVAGESADAVAFVDEEGQYVAVATAGAVDAGSVVEDVTDRFGGGGGGGPTVAQGGGLGAEATEIVSYLRDGR